MVAAQIGLDAYLQLIAPNILYYMVSVMKDFTDPIEWFWALSLALPNMSDYMQVGLYYMHAADICITSLVGPPVTVSDLCRPITKCRCTNDMLVRCYDIVSHIV